MVVAVLFFTGRALVRQWGAVRASMLDLHPRWGLVVLSAVLVLATYALLIQTWRAVLGTWDARLSFPDAAWIWNVSNLGKYVPGKVWQIGAMGMMAQRAGASPVAAAGSAIVINLVNIIAGFAVVAATGWRAVDAIAGGAGASHLALAATVAALAALVAAPLILPTAARLAGRVIGRRVEVGALPARAIWIAGGGCVVAWVLYGLAFRCLAAGILGEATGASTAYVAVYTLSYLVGYLALPVPAGVGVREWALKSSMVALGLAAEPRAVLLVVASRLWLTVLEIAPGLLFLLRRAPSRPPAAIVDGTL